MPESVSQSVSTWKLSPEEIETRRRATALAESFHVLRGQPGVDPFDAEKLDKWAANCASDAGTLAAQFVLSVWDRHAISECGKFDPLAAYCVWDGSMWEAFRRWVNNPFTL